VPGLSSAHSDAEHQLRQIERENDKLTRTLEQLKREHEGHVQLSARRVDELQAEIAELTQRNTQLKHKASALHAELHYTEP
jgi:predicted RNase H-like nuclease (RuvC/YqgF family)